VPIATSPGRSGFGPQLSLSYDSGAGNGPFGLGWNFSLPAITRKTDKGLPEYRDAEESDVFILSGSEDLVPILEPNGLRTIDGVSYHTKRYQPRIEGLFARIERWTNDSNDSDVFWRSISRDNITTWYGKTAESRIADPADVSRIFSWLTCESYDGKGNVVSYRYKPEDSTGIDFPQVNEANRDAQPGSPDPRSTNRYLKRICYGNSIPHLPELDPNIPWPALTGDDQWLFEVVFDYGEHDQGTPKPAEANAWSIRRDPYSSYRAGFEVRTYRLCRRVLMFHHFPDVAADQQNGIAGVTGYDGLVRATEFTYAESPLFSLMSTATQAGFKLLSDGTYLRKALPALEFSYTEAKIEDEVRELDAESSENLPIGLDGSHYQWVDLDGEGLSGILTEQAEGWFYKRNLSPINFLPGSDRTQAKFAPLESIASKPALSVNGGRAQFLDLAGDGQLDVVTFHEPAPGFYERTADNDWAPFVSFRSFPEENWDDPNLKFIDLTGDGHADVLITEDEAFRWYPSLAEDGFAAAETCRQSNDEEKGPRLVFADGTQSIYLADFSGDGLTDLVRIRNGEVCYWPNLGYGRFGAKVTMDNAPWFDFPDQFDQKRIRLADIDGSGVIDIVYLHSDGVRLYFNQSGNSWSKAHPLPIFPRVDDLVSIQVFDLLGNGTACLVWSSPLPGDAPRTLRYVDLMGGQKPHLLFKTVNNLGAETIVTYAPSTKFYLQDKRDGKPWVTRVPFPVHVVERVETYDRISRNRFVTRYAYHHGYFDGVEREFRGFGMVEQWDTEEFATLSASDAFPIGDNIEAASHVPPVHTKTWFHTGAYLDREHISNFFAGLGANQPGEYYREPGLSDAQAADMLLDDTQLPGGLSIDEEREACRALKGSILRQEVYGLDGTAKAIHPYSVSERNYTIERVQSKGGNVHAVFSVHQRETIDYHYERNPADPRVSHALTLEVDPFGNVLKSAVIGYGRRQADPDFVTQGDKDRQTVSLLTYTETDVTNSILANDSYRTPLPSETRAYELTGYMPSGPAGRFQIADIVQPGVNGLTHIFDSETNYEDAAGNGKQRRLIERVRTCYRPDDFGAAQNDPLALLPVGSLESLALPGETYKLAFTPGLLAQVFRRPDANQSLVDLLPPNPGDVLAADIPGGQVADRGGYVDLDGNGHWWIPSGRAFHSPNPADNAAAEQTYANQHFFLTQRYRDPFGAITAVSFDNYDLLVLETGDPLGNRITVGERDPSGNLTATGNDYRVLQPGLLMDPNRNRSAAAYDALGMVVGTAVMGKPEENLGDSLAGFDPDLTDTVILDHLTNPLADPYSILQRATTRLVYDLFAYQRTLNDPAPQSAVVYTLARETHDADLAPGDQTKVQHSFSYSDGFGREIQKKIQAEPGPLVPGGAHINPRWVGSGWTIFNNKGKPVRKYEPFFSATHLFEFGRTIGVSPILFYDPLERVVATLHPNHTYEKVVFDPWRQQTYDGNDTVLEPDPGNDPDAGSYISRLPSADYLPTWYDSRQSGTLGPAEQSAATKAAAHANTPAVTYFDVLGRAFITVADNGIANNVPQKYWTRTYLDIEGNQRQVIDARDRVVMRYDYDMLSTVIHSASVDAGERWMLNNVTGKSIRKWDSRDHIIRSAYDVLQRPTHLFVTEAGKAEALPERLIYGEAHPAAEALNLRGKLYQHYDGAGVVTHDGYDFKGNLLSNARRLAIEYKQLVDWLPLALLTDAQAIASPPLALLETENFTTSTDYDALNRPVRLTTPDNSQTTPTYNEANLLERIDANLRGDPVAMSFVTGVSYDAKGQRLQIDYGNGATTNYEYDPDTFRLTRLRTTRSSDNAKLQDLSYTYDPVGNITAIRDDAQQTIYFNNQVVTPSAEYDYDPIYRLIKATGREHLGQTGGQANAPRQPNHDDTFWTNLPHPGDGNAMGNYTERYQYDEVGNILKMIHTAAAGSWTRKYDYDSNRNRLLATSNPSGSLTDKYDHDAHGNMIRMPHLPVIEWSFKDQLNATSKQTVNTGNPETSWNIYDSGGQRVRKVTEHQAPAGLAPALKADHVYHSHFEIHRDYDSFGASVRLQRETLHIMDDKRRIALVEWTTNARAATTHTPAGRLVRFQFNNHLGSASLELDEQAHIISYEDYYAYGGTSYQSVRSQIESAKRYRYTGMEVDADTVLAYHGARYYASWLGRWLNCDPLGLTDGVNPVSYGKCNPVRFTDTTGTRTKDTPKPKVTQKPSSTLNTLPHPPASFFKQAPPKTGVTMIVGPHGIRTFINHSKQVPITVSTGYKLNSVKVSVGPAIGFKLGKLIELKAGGGWFLSMGKQIQMGLEGGANAEILAQTLVGFGGYKQMDVVNPHHWVSKGGAATILNQTVWTTEKDKPFNVGVAGIPDIAKQKFGAFEMKFVIGIGVDFVQEFKTVMKSETTTVIPAGVQDNTYVATPYNKELIFNSEHR
jgi:RHS repeat-associated protein